MLSQFVHDLLNNLVTNHIVYIYKLVFDQEIIHSPIGDFFKDFVQQR